MPTYEIRLEKAAQKFLNRQDKKQRIKLTGLFLNCLPVQILSVCRGILICTGSGLEM